MDSAAAGGGSGEPVASRENPEEQKCDPSRIAGIMKRKALIEELAAAYRANCIASCKELLQLQMKGEEQYADGKMLEQTISSMMKTSKRRKT